MITVRVKTTIQEQEVYPGQTLVLVELCDKWREGRNVAGPYCVLWMFPDATIMPEYFATLEEAQASFVERVANPVNSFGDTRPYAEHYEEGRVICGSMGTGA